jgi:dienelactone hydrolase
MRGKQQGGTMAEYQHLGLYSDLVDEARRQQLLFPVAAPGSATRQKLRDVLGFCNGPETPISVRIEHSWEGDGLAGEEVSWSVGYGPRTHAYVLKPAGAKGPLPGIVALHDHGGFKFYGKEKIADGSQPPPPVLRAYRQQYYGGRAWPNALAKEGYVVLAHDVFLWGSRKFPLETMPQRVLDTTKAMLNTFPAEPGVPPEINEYNTAAGEHEHVVAKYCNLLGTGMPGVVAHEDRVATNYLLSRPDVSTDRIACVGLSGGGNRAALLLATHDRIAATVVVGLMTTYEGLLDHNVQTHTWMLFPYGWSRYGDWPDIAACRAPMPLLVQYDLEDDLFTVAGMKAADQKLKLHYSSSGHSAAYVGQFYPGPHKFDLEMQAAAFSWLKDKLGR